MLQILANRSNSFTETDCTKFSNLCYNSTLKNRFLQERERGFGLKLMSKPRTSLCDSTLFKNSKANTRFCFYK